MTPREFLSLAKEAEPDQFKAERIAGLLDNETPFDSVPMLQGQLRQNGDSVAMVLDGHEGRHRMRGLLDRGLGDEPMPVRINQIEGGDVPVIRRFNGDGIDSIISEDVNFDLWDQDDPIRDIMINPRPFPQVAR
jgi:hypothetical protein